MKVNEGLDALQKADLIPDDIYEVEIVACKDVTMKKHNNKPGCVAKLTITSAEDPANNVPEVLGRTVDYWLVGKRSTGLQRVLEHLGYDEVPGGDTVGLVGEKLKGRITSYEYQGTWENQFSPL